jgi:hypothetical protein
MIAQPSALSTQPVTIVALCVASITTWTGPLPTPLRRTTASPSTLRPTRSKPEMCTK